MVLFRIQALNVLINDRSQEFNSVHYEDWVDGCTSSSLHGRRPFTSHECETVPDLKHDLLITI